VVHRGAGFQNDKAYTAVDETAVELGARQALGLNDARLVIDDGDLENGFGQIDALVPTPHP
jgi:hypothetical protein